MNSHQPKPDTMQKINCHMVTKHHFLPNKGGPVYRFIKKYQKNNQKMGTIEIYQKKNQIRWYIKVYQKSNP